MSIDEEYEIILKSKEFDKEYYKKTYNLDSTTDPIYHYLEIGVHKNYNPSENFETQYYLEENVDVKNSDVNPFVHYVLYGKDEGRMPKLKELSEIQKDYKNKKSCLFGKNNYFFLINDSNSELSQHFDPNYESKFNYKQFTGNLNFKKRLFKKYGIKYGYFVVPDKSIVCKKLLPFKYHVINRNVDVLPIKNFSEHLNEEHYFRHDTHMNFKGGKVFASKIIQDIDTSVDENKLYEIMEHNHLELTKHFNDLLFDINFSGTDEEKEKYDESEYVFTEKPINLKELDIPDEYDYCLKMKSHYYINENSYSDLRVLIFHDSTIESIQNYLPFYFREMFLYWDHGSMNEELIKWFNPDMILEIRVEGSIEQLKHPSWVENKEDFLHNQKLEKPNCELILSQNNQDKISVIIPVYNVENYLEKCLDSVINQTLEEIEIICVNDGSTDNSLEILREYSLKDDRIKIINTANHGLGAARNNGLKVATGEYVFFLDSDDWIKECALELLYNKAKTNNLEMLFYQLTNYIDYDNTLSTTDLYDHKCFNDKNLEKLDYFTINNFENHLFEVPVIAYSKLYKRAFIEENKFRFPEGINFEDNEFFYDAIFNCNRAGYLKKHLLYRRRHEDSITGSFNTTHLDIIYAMNHTIKVFQKNGKYETFNKKLINHTFMNIVDWFNKAPLYYKQTFFDKIKRDFIGFNELRDDFCNNLNEVNKLIFQKLEENINYLSFDSAYQLDSSEYVIFDGQNYILLDSKQYQDYVNQEINKKYKISVIIPIYNNGMLTHRTVMSIENQTFDFEKIEVVLINDNSQDNTFDLINEYSKEFENIKAIHINKSSGSSGNPRNIGIKESFGEYIMFLDHDDFFEHDALEILYKNITETNADVVFGTYSEIRNNTVYKALTPNEKRGYFETIDENGRMIAIPAPSIWTKLFNKKFILDNKILFPTILGEDAIFMAKVFLNAKGIKYLWNINICYHDLRDTSTTNNVTFEYMQELFVSELYMYYYFKKFGREQFIKYRGITIIDFAIDQIYQSNLKDYEIENFYDLMKKFIEVHYEADSKPRYERSKMLAKIILNEDAGFFISYLREFRNKENSEKQIKDMSIELNKVNEIKSLNNQLKSRNDQLTSENAQLKNDYNILYSEKEKLFHQNNKLIKFKKGVLNSNSWKITKPLREINLSRLYQKNNPTLSIIIPVYNKEEYLEEVIKSIFEQSYEDVEVICIDDCSTDNSLNKLKELSRTYSKLIILKNKINMGSGKTRNRGIKKAKGDYILFIDADDYLVHVKSFEAFIYHAKKFDAPMVSANLDYIYEDGQIVKETKYLTQIKDHAIKNPEEYGLPWYYTRNLYSKQIIKDNNIKFPEARFGEDPVFLSKYLKSINFYVEIPIDYYRYRASSVVKRNTFETYIEDLKNICRVFKEFSEINRYNPVLLDFSEVLLNRLTIDNYVENESELEELKRILYAILDSCKSKHQNVYNKIKDPIEENIKSTKSKIE